MRPDDEATPDLRQIFETIVQTNKWGEPESVSGAGSTQSYTYNLRHELEAFVRAFEIRSLFDAPCGDFNWMKLVSFPPDFRYIGGDVAPSLVLANQERHAAPSREFLEFNIVTDTFPDVEMWFCRDCLFHLSFAQIRGALTQFCRSSIPYVMVTNHLNTANFVNRDIEPGNYRLLDLYLEPFGLPREVLYQIPDYVFPFPQREMVVWSREQVAHALATS